MLAILHDPAFLLPALVVIGVIVAVALAHATRRNARSLAEAQTLARQLEAQAAELRRRVEEHDVGLHLARALDRGAAARDVGHDLVAERAEKVHEHGARVVVVFGEEDADGLVRFTHRERCFPAFLTLRERGFVPARTEITRLQRLATGGRARQPVCGARNRRSRSRCCAIPTP